jgi:hypothetical protein
MSNSRRQFLQSVSKAATLLPLAGLAGCGRLTMDIKYERPKKPTDAPVEPSPTPIIEESTERVGIKYEFHISEYVEDKMRTIYDCATEPCLTDKYATAILESQIKRIFDLPSSFRLGSKDGIYYRLDARQITIYGTVPDWSQVMNGNCGCRIIDNTELNPIHKDSSVSHLDVLDLCVRFYNRSSTNKEIKLLSVQFT